MNTQTLITVMTISLPIFGAGIGYLIKHSVEKKKELTNELTKQRREIYQQYVNLVIDIFSGDKTKKKKSNVNMLTELFEFYKKYVLYASPNVIKAFSDYFQFIYKQEETIDTDSKKSLEYITKIMFEMRKDIGLNNDGLGKNGEMLLRALINDYDKIWK
ncbi:MAG: hypothetical protein V4589_12215 [Bacteroidota bacterium]